MTFAQRLIELRKGLSKTQAAAFLGVAKSTYYNWETKGAVPPAATLRKIADSYGVSVKYLLGKEEKPLPEISAPPTINCREELEQSLIACLRISINSGDMINAVNIAQTLVNYYSLDREATP